MQWMLGIQWVIKWILLRWRTWANKEIACVRKKSKFENISYEGFGLHRRKPEWVINEVIRLKAYLPKASCRTVASIFNRIHQNKQQMTVSKSYVYQQLIKHRHEIAIQRRKIKQRAPYSYHKNQLWQWDITKINDKRVLGIIDCGSRVCLGLNTLADKRSITLLRHLILSIGLYGKPTIIRSDNEACFNSRLVRFSLWLLGIKKQTTQPASPWQNGRIERFFGTLKHHIKQCLIAQKYEQKALNDFIVWYNYVRPHQALNGATPAEAWYGKAPNKSGNAVYVSAWDGVLDGIYVPPD